MLQELDVRNRVVIAQAYGIALCIGPSRGVQHVDHRFCYAQGVEKLIAQALSKVGVRHEAGYIYQLDGYEALAIRAPAAASGDPQLLAGAGDAHIRDAVVGVDGGKRIARNVHIDQSRRLKKGGFAGVGLSGQPHREH